MRLSQLIMASAALVLLAASCNDDFSSVGGDVLPGDEVISTHVSPEDLDATSEMSDPIKSSNPTSFILGELNDPYFGKSKSEFITQFSIGTISAADTISLKAGENYELDSTVLLLKYPRYSWTGDTLTNISIKVYELNEVLSNAISYNSDIDGSAIANMEGDGVADPFTFNILNGKNDSIWSQANYVDTLRVKLKDDNSIGQDIFEADIDQITNNAQFQQLFSGFYIMGERDINSSPEGALVKFNHRSTSQELVLYYKRYEYDLTVTPDPTPEDAIDTTFFTRSFPVNSESVKINSFLHEPVPTTDTKLFVQAMAGSMGKITIDQEFKDIWRDSIENNDNSDTDYHLGIAAVDINLYIDTTSTDYRVYYPPSSLSIYKKDNKDELTTPAFYTDNGVLSAGIGTGQLFNEINENDESYPSYYKFSFTPGYFEEFVAPSSYNIDLVNYNEIFIMPLSPESNMDRVILHNIEILTESDTIPAPYMAIKYVKLK